jgi:hypothetical protein
MSTTTVAVIHTSPATVDLFGRMLRERRPELRIVNLLDDSILPELRENGGDLSAIVPRWTQYAGIARERGADLILNACSSVGELCDPVALVVGRPIVRVDAAMAREAVRRSERVAVVATLPTTLRPTSDLIARAAQDMGRSVQVEPLLVEGAYEALMRGDAGDHDSRILLALQGATARNDAVVLAQASMARVAHELAPTDRQKIYASPSFAVEDVLTRLTG